MGRPACRGAARQALFGHGRLRRLRGEFVGGEVGLDDLADQGVDLVMGRFEGARRPGRFLAGGGGQRFAVLLADVDFHVHRQAHAQRMGLQVRGVERDAHGHALHHLDPVAGGVLGRQQGEGAAGAGVQPGDGAVVGDRAAIQVGGHLDRLADAHLAQLAFLEVGFDPDLVQRHHRHERGAGGHALADLDGAAGDDAAHGGGQHRARLGQPGIAQAGDGLAHVRVVGHGGALGQRLVGRQLGARGGQRGAGLRQAGLRGLQRGLGVQDLLAADAARLGQLLAASDVALGAGQFGLGALDVGLAQVDVSGQRVVLDVERADLAHGLRQLGLGLLQGDLRVGRVDAHQRLAGGDGLGVVGLDGHHGAGHLRRDLHQVAVHVGVVGAFEVGAEQGPPDAVGDRDEDENGGERGQGTAGACRWARAGLVGGSGVAFMATSFIRIVLTRRVELPAAAGVAGGRRAAAAGARPADVAAAQRVGQVGVELVGANAQVGVEPRLGQHAGLRDQHGQVVAHASLVAVDGQFIGRLDGFARLALLGPFLFQQAQAVERVGDLVHGVEHGLVVVGHGQVGVGAAAGQVGVQLAAMEDRQGDGRTETGGAGGGAEQVAGADRLEAGKGHEVDVGVELGAGAVDLVPGGLGAPARGDHVGTVAQQVQRHAGGHAAGGRGQGGFDERLAALRAGAGQRVERSCWVVAICSVSASICWRASATIRPASPRPGCQGRGNRGRGSATALPRAGSGRV